MATSGASEHTPLLRAEPGLPNLSVERELGDRSGMPGPLSQARTQPYGDALIDMGKVEGGFNKENLYLPLDRRQASNTHTGVPLWKLLLSAICSIIFLYYATTGSLFLDHVNHPTGPYPAPPGPPEVHTERNPAYLIKAAKGAVVSKVVTLTPFTY